MRGLRETRPFTLVDAMALVLAVALATAEARHRFSDVRFLWGDDWSCVNMGFVMETVYRLDLVGRAVIVPYLTALTVVLIVLCFFGARSALRRSHRQPGVVALVAAVVGIIAAVIIRAGPTLRHFRQPYAQLPFEHTLLILWGWCGRLAGLCVVACWVTLALGGRWRPERNWIGRVGRFVGVLWVASLPLWIAYSWLGYRYN
jgi:hypothetical protein